MAKQAHRIAKNFKPTIKGRLVLISVLFALYGLGLVARLFYLQILQHDELVAQSAKQYLKTANIFYGRGIIYDRNKGELASNIEVESVYVTPQEILEKKQTARTLATVLRLKYSTVYKKLSTAKTFVWIKRKCPPSETEFLRRKNLPGVGFISEHQRFYPKRQLASSVIGFVGLDNQGLAGVEHHYRSRLKGATVRTVMEKDARGRYIRTFDESSKQDSASHDMVLAIDEVIQFTTEYHLKKQIKKYRAKGGMAIVMDPNTGEIYALANEPKFNPNNYAAFPSRAWTNKSVSNAFEPGSIFKPIVASAALELGVARPNDIFFCENGKFKLGQVLPVFGEASSHEFGWLSMRQIIAKSSNIGAIKIAQQVGEKNFYHYIQKFGFGKKTNIGLPGESAGQFKNVSQWSARSLASISFGHEIGVTPLQMATALSAIANGGNLMQPRIVKAVLKNDLRVETFPPKVVGRVISKRTSRQMVDILKSVVKEGTGAKAALKGYDVAGKTGTAQKFDPKTRSYSKTAFLSSFIGFVPADAARLVILVMIDEPQGSYWGGTVAAPVFKNIAKQALRYLNVPSKEERVYILERA
ncbi:MAG: penicillin-binding protein 2 [Nitrospinota bacterium]|nr:penicillin-binding protein 2 [Nitrospinota bacterium]